MGNKKREEKRVREEEDGADVVEEEEKEKVVMGEVVRVFSANLQFHLCSPLALQPRPAKRHFTSHPHTHGARANTEEHTPTKLHSLSHAHTHTTGI